MKRSRSVMPLALRQQMYAPGKKRQCALFGLHFELIGACGGRITGEHACYYAGRKIQEEWAIPDICAKHHGVDQYQDAPGQAPKIMREWVALNQATDAELLKFDRANMIRRRAYLNTVYGVYKPVQKPVEKTGIIDECSVITPKVFNNISKTLANSPLTKHSSTTLSPLQKS